jgi:L-iditol 2-dehydrogenase
MLKALCKNRLSILQSGVTSKKPCHVFCLDVLANHVGSYRLPQEVSLEHGALIEPLSVAMHASTRAGLAAGSVVLVLGAGAVGLLCAAMSKVAKAKTVIIADIQEDRVKFAVEKGFADAAVVVPMKRPESITDKLDFARQVADMVKSTTVNGEPVGEVNGTYECTGVESCLQAAIYVSLVSMIPPSPE